MRLLRRLSFAAPLLLVAAACADSPTMPRAAAAPTPAFSGGSSSGGGGGSGTVNVAGQWAGAFQSTSAYDSHVNFSLAVSGTTVSGTITFTLTYGGAQQQSPISGSWDGTTLTLHFTAPNGAGVVAAQPSSNGRYGVAFVQLVKPESNPSGSALGTLNVTRL